MLCLVSKGVSLTEEFEKLHRAIEIFRSMVSVGLDLTATCGTNDRSTTSDKVGLDQDAGPDHTLRSSNSFWKRYG
jgi:hypothetical protein